jgi:N-acetylglutamate synthase-like GNAT family acetyltransferase
MTDIDVREAGPDDADYITATLRKEWRDTVMAAHGELIDAQALPALIAWSGGERVGCLNYRVAGTSCEAVSLIASTPGIGAGSALLRAIRTRAAEQGLDRLWLITTNDNTDALAFYQRFGFDLVELCHDAVLAARALKPSIPLRANGIPIRHELMLELIP